MILTTMLLMIAALAVVVIGFIMDRLAIRKLERGMRTLAKRIKALEADKMPVWEVGGTNDETLDTEPQETDDSTSYCEVTYGFDRLNGSTIRQADRDKT